MSASALLPPEPGDWRALLGGGVAEPAERVEYVGLGLLVAVRQGIPRTDHRWNGPVTKAVRGLPARLTGEHRLALHPVRRTETGWSRSGIGWGTLQHRVHSDRLDPAQVAWFAELSGVYRAVNPPAPGRDPDWMELDGFTSPVLWYLLDRGRAAGVECVGTAGIGIVVSERVVVGVDLSRSRTGLRVVPRVEFDGAEIADGMARPIGDHGAWAIDPAAGTIRIGPVDGPLSATAVSLLSGRVGVMDVPAAEEAEFVAEFLPELQDQLDVRSTDGSVPVPSPRPAHLVLTLRHVPPHRLELRWRWDLRRGTAASPAASVLPAELLPPGCRPDENAATPPDVDLDGEDTADFVTTVLPALRELPGVRIETTGEPPEYRELTGSLRVAVTAVPSAKSDWFDLGVSIELDGRLLPFSPIFRALAGGKNRLVLPDNSVLDLRRPELLDLADLLVEACDLQEWEPVPSLSRYHLQAWSDLEYLADDATPPPGWRGLLAEVTSGPVPVVDPAGLRAELRPHQREGLAWLAFLWRHRLGGILADDMGLGKTLQVLTLVQHLREQGSADRRPILVIAPTTVVPTWAEQAAKFTPDLVVRTITTTSVPPADVADGTDIVVTSYTLVRLNDRAYRGHGGESPWGGVILDEAQAVKNAASLSHQAIAGLKAPIVLALTGTPLENSLTDLHALFSLVTPGLLPSRRSFVTRFVRPVEGDRPGISEGVGAGRAPVANAAHRVARLADLRHRIKPFLLRRTKDEVAPELPAKSEHVLRVDLHPDHRRLYDTHLQAERRKVLRLLRDEEKRIKFILFRSLTLMRLLALDPSLISADYADVPSAKLDTLVERLRPIADEGRKVLVFSQFTSFLALAGKRLTAAGIGFQQLDGSSRSRDTLVQRFRDTDVPVFLISLKAGGIGLTLTEADEVFLLDPWWNPAAERQAIDRTHRIGQDKPVTVHRLISAHTIEEKVLDLQRRKADLFDSVLRTTDGFGSGPDLEQLLSLLE